MSEKKESVPQKIEGYIVLDSRGSCLTDDLIWYEHDKPEEGFVFSRDQVDEIKNKSKENNWQFIPTRVIPATWSQGSVSVTGKELHITELPKKQGE